MPVDPDQPTSFACPFCGRMATYTPRGAPLPLVTHDEPWCERFSECDFEPPAASARAREEELPRYAERADSTGAVYMDEDPTGDWLRYEDVERILDEIGAATPDAAVHAILRRAAAEGVKVPE